MVEERDAGGKEEQAGARQEQAEEYRVTSTDVHGEPRQSTERAESVESLVSRLRAEGLQVSKLGARKARKLFEPRGCNLDEFAFFSAELASACRRGAPLPGALTALSRDLSGRRIREALAGVARDVEEGMNFADALATRSDVFPQGYVALVSAGLKAGDLAGTLLVFADEARFSARMRHTFVAAVAYPLAVLLAGSFLLALCGWHIFPTYGGVFDQLGFGGPGLPALTRLSFALVPLFKWAPVIVIGLVALLRAFWELLFRGSARSRTLAGIVLRIPLVGRMARAMSIARFARTLSGALTGHVPLPEAISLAGMATANAAFVDASEKLRRGVEEGGSLSDGMAEEVGLFPATVVWMLHISEQRGELGPALDESARLQDQRAERVGEFLPVVAGTVMLMLGALMLMSVVLSIFLPMMRAWGGMSW